MPNNMIQLKINLEFIDPPIWRRVEVPDSFSLGDLHAVVQLSMGWQNGHLHRFEIDGINYTFADASADMGMQDEETVLLRNVLTEEEQTFLYEYDFGDSWLHCITVEKIVPAKEAKNIARCLSGERACPPEDCGSYPGYEEILFALDSEDPDEDQQSLLEWLEEMYGDYDPEFFNLKAVNKALYS